MQEDLKQVFFESLLKFSDNAEYLFFIGKILYIAEWFFCINDDLRPNEEKLAFYMQKKAYTLEPHNLLYELAYRFSGNEFKRAYELSRKILFEESNKYVSWLKTKGFPGKYVLEILVEGVYEYGPKDPRES